MIPSVRALEHAGCLGPTDVALARALGRLAGVHVDEHGIGLAVAVASRMISAGHVCLDLASPPSFDSLLPLAGDTPESEAGEDVARWAWPDADEWQASLGATELVDVDPPEPGAGYPVEARRPLVLDARGRLYLRRYWEHERALARAIAGRAGAAPEFDEDALVAGLDRLFVPSAPVGATGKGDTDLQRRAVESALRRRLCVVSGGPGTGKTSTVARILVLAVEQARALGRPDPRIVLVAPTGKAAAALTTALARNLAGLDCDEAVRDALPSAASTIHRALGSRGGVGAGFAHSAEHPLAADWVVVDEASMVDLALMRRLVDAVPVEARLVMMGDADQLASVEAGAVLADICGVGGEPTKNREGPLAASIVRLEHSYRFSAASGIGALSRAVNAGEVETAFDVLADPGRADVEWIDRDAPGWPAAVRSVVDAGFADLVAASDAAAGLASLARFRVLSPHRGGPLGTDDLNARLAARFTAGQGVAFEPILVERNDRVLGLYNGDLGLREVRGAGRPGARVFFESAADRAQQDAGGGALSVRDLSELRLPPHSPCWAMSVHKSQGSEFDTVLLVLPDRMSPVLTREMLYTAITRARERIVVWAPREVLAQCIARRVERRSGLRDLLWKPGD